MHAERSPAMGTYSAAVAAQAQLVVNQDRDLKSFTGTYSFVEEQHANFQWEGTLFFTSAESIIEPHVQGLISKLVFLQRRHHAKAGHPSPHTNHVYASV